MINLLSSQEKSALRKEYRFRFLAVSLFLITAGIIGGVLLLVPSLVLLTQEESILLLQQATVAQSAQSQETEALQNPVTDINQKMTLLEDHLQTPKLTTAVQAIIRERPSGITLTSFTFENSATKGRSMLIAGHAADRDRLVLFVHTLENDPQFLKADLPISNLAANENIDFNISITLAPTS